MAAYKHPYRSFDLTFAEAERKREAYDRTNHAASKTAAGRCVGRSCICCVGGYEQEARHRSGLRVSEQHDTREKFSHLAKKWTQSADVPQDHD